MKKLLKAVAVALLGVFAVACSEQLNPTALAADDPSVSPLFAARGPLAHRVTVGSPDIVLPPGSDANFSLIALSKADGSVSGQWHDEFAGGGEGIHVAVDCLNVAGNGAVIGGVITRGTDGDGGDVTGQRALTAVVDNGTSANDPADQLSFSFIGLFLKSCTELGPNEFPLFDLNSGQVRVR